MWKEFKEFAVKGNVIDMAVGIIIGAAFGGIVASLVKDVVMPPVGLLLGKVDFTNLFILLKEGAKAHAPYASLKEAQDAGAVTLNYGAFINTIVQFFIVSLTIFVVVKNIQRVKKEPASAEPATTECPFC